MAEVRLRRVWLIWALMGLFGVLYLFMERVGGSENARVLLQFGAHERGLIFSGQVWRLISSGMLHVGLAHLLVNSWGLFAFGMPLELRYGPRTLWCLFVLGVVGGCVLSLPFVAGVSAGASGGLFGLFGVYVALYVRQRRTMPPVLRAAMRRWILLIVAMNVPFVFFVDGINHAAHLGGFLAGAAGYFILRPAADEGRLQRLATRAVTLLSLAAMLFSAMDASRVARQPWEYPTRSWEDSAGYYRVEVPVWLEPLRVRPTQEVFHSPSVRLSIQVRALPEGEEWRQAERASYLDEEYAAPTFVEQGRWLVARSSTASGREIEVWATRESDVVYRLAVVTDTAEFERFRPQFLKFVESFRPMARI